MSQQLKGIPYGAHLANKVSSMSTCARKKVGAILLLNDTALGYGYNGVISGTTCEKKYKALFNRNSCKNFKEYMNDIAYEDHGRYSTENEVHAEMRAIHNAIASGYPLDVIQKATLYCTLSPCANCAKMIHLFGIQIVYYVEKYDRDLSGINYLERNNILVQQV